MHKIQYKEDESISSSVKEGEFVPQRSSFELPEILKILYFIKEGLSLEECGQSLRLFWKELKNTIAIILIFIKTIMKLSYDFYTVFVALK